MNHFKKTPTRYNFYLHITFTLQINTFHTVLRNTYTQTMHILLVFQKHNLL